MSAATRAEQRRVIDAFLTASREGDFDALLEVLDPAVVLRADPGRLGRPVRVSGRADVAAMVLSQGARRAPFGRPATVNGVPGVVVAIGERVVAVAAFTIASGRITSVIVVADPDKLARVRI